MRSDIREHYESTMTAVPPAIESMFAMDEEFAEHYTDIRELIYRERPDGLDLATKELFLVAYDLTVNNPGGALNHLAAARRAGATATQLREVLMMAFLVRGVSGWGLVGAQLWDSLDEEAAQAR
jgi:alkylhydroperoxidase/carboxymuconolactone decarboxylase family protein YurZ